MQYLRIIFIALLAFLAADSFGQSRKHKKRQEEPVQEPTSLDPTTVEKDYAPKASRRSSHGPTYALEEEYYKRMADLEKARRKNERLASKPQYSDPLYFGHKHPPKKRKASKMKFCKECGIRH
jgi:hypothetical protein